MQRHTHCTSDFTQAPQLLTTETCLYYTGKAITGLIPYITYTS